ncbi:TPA: GBS Bsp-like repeat-containing protein [Streptococcus suis]
MKKRTLFFLSVCAVALNGYVVHADSLEAPSQLVTVPNLPGTGGQLTVVEEAGQMKAILSNITGEIVGVTGQFKSETNTGKTIAFTIDASGQYVAYLDRSSFSDEDRTFTLALTANLIDGSAHNLDDYSFNWVKVAENTNDDSDLIENTSATETSKPVSSGTVVDSVEKDSSSSASETQSSSTASSSLAATVTDSSNATSASTLTSTQTTSSVGSQLRSASLMRIATNSSAQSSAVTKASQIDQTLELKYTGSINSGEVIKFAVWSDENGQDDIVWYHADQTGAAYADLRKHRDYGKYNIHTYVNRNGKMVYLDADTIEINPSGTVTVSNINQNTGSFDVIISNIDAPRGLSKVYVPTWTDTKGQDDIKWHEASRQTDGSYKVTVNKTQHKNESGKYNVHVYYQGLDGSMTGIGATSVELKELKPTGTVTVKNVDSNKGSFDVIVSDINAPKGISKVYVPTWTEANGQDDIKWHEASRQSDGSYKVTVNKTQHKNESGKYNVHVYYQGLDGNMTGIGATSVELKELKPTGTVTVKNVDSNKGNFDVIVSDINAPKGLSKVYVPTWTEANGQDEIKWYEASRQIDGSYKVTVNKSQHKNESGKYNIHVYFRELDGSMTGIGATSVVLTEVKPTGTVTVKNVDSNKGSFDVIVSDINAPKGLSKVYVPTWTEDNGQDEIKWYEASRQTDGSYKVTVNKSQHKNESGKYNIHVYFRELDGSMTGIGATSVVLTEVKPTGTVTVKNVDPNNGGFDVIVSNLNVPRGLSKVYVPTWTEANGQDEIQWYEASRQTDGSYKVTVNKSLHKNEIGKYNVHVYVKESTGKLTYIGNTVAELPKEQATNSGTSNITSGTISISNVNEKTGSFDVRISNVKAPKGLSAVLIPTWTESNGQDDIVWHVANRQADGSYLYTVKKSEHKYGSGLYNVHVYYRGADGSLTVVGGTSVELPSSRSYTIYIDPGHGGVDPGATYGGIQEKNLAMSVANKLKSNLIQMGYQVLMTRTGDYNVDFKTERSQMANQSNADLFISLHFNATGLGTTRTSGIETYWYQYDPEYQPKINKDKHNDPTRLAESEILAKQVQSSLINETGAVNRGVRRETFAVLRETDIPAVLVELGFMDNPTELQTIKQDAYHAKLAKALAKGIDNWYGAVGGK